MAPVGLRCPEHSGKPQGIQRMTRGAQRAAYEGTGYVTRVLLALNVGIWLAEWAQTGAFTATSGSIFEKGVLIGNGRQLAPGFIIPLPLGAPGGDVGVAHGEWWRLLTSAFLHYGPIHLATNMWALWILGNALEARLGSARFVLLYIVSGLAGSAGALIATPNSPTVGASGAIFGILGAGLVMERQRDYVFGGSALQMIIINLVITFSFAFAGPVRISYGGHVGGLTAGILATLVLSRFGRGHAAYSRVGVAGTVAIVAIGVASVFLAYAKVRGHL
jgi:membrane associated rhomboid family serine protease